MVQQSSLPGVRPVVHPPVRAGRVGVLLLNLGTPEATDYWSMRRYLKEFLSDRRVIETNRLLWWPLLNLIILTTRPGPHHGLRLASPHGVTLGHALRRRPGNLFRTEPNCAAPIGPRRR